MSRKERQERGINSHEEHPQYNKKGQNIKNVVFHPRRFFNLQQYFECMPKFYQHT